MNNIQRLSKNQSDKPESDRATYDSSQTESVNYTVSSPGDAPASLTYGSSFISLVGKYAGSAILGLNRRLNNLPNTIAAAKFAQANMSNLYSLELGNEPNCKQTSLSPFDKITEGNVSSLQEFGPHRGGQVMDASSRLRFRGQVARCSLR